MKKKVMLIVLDGVGAAPLNAGNAVTLANPKNLTRLWNTFPHTYLLACGEAVGLPTGVKGNSEVGHMNIGAGKVVTQILPRINKSIANDSYGKNTTLWDSLKHAIKNNSNVHIMGCLSDGAVHSHINHFIATLQFFAQNNFGKQVFIHAFTDGRDTPPNSAKTYLQQMQDAIDKFGLGEIATVCGRSIAMDRTQRWDRTKQTYDLLVNGLGNKFNTWEEAIADSYNNKITDEFIKPAIIIKNNNIPTIKENDVVLFMNYRADRALQLSQALLDPGFKEFSVIKFNNLYFASMDEYRKNFPQHVLFPKEYLTLPLGKIISNSGLRQLRIAETEKFPHVTYFFNGGMSIKYQGEDRIEVPSPNVPTYDLKPEMSLLEVFEVLKYRINTNMYDFIVLNIANGDMVGHTGNLQASIKAVQILDYVTNELIRLFTAHDGVVLI
ncbi:MAG TPA: 2,3-bisphosphoglycerate-independent phosphoglycerate mutase, partial [Candidatus Dojkabacteria bacterium]|nr:2,3-bisphosphoglycerate-independent phosphoglycerate mutase [Candidatus Dojkabacteria bacterium]